MAHLRAGAVQIEDIGISELSVFDQVEIISFKYKLDISNAFSNSYFEVWLLCNDETGPGSDTYHR